MGIILYINNNDFHHLGRYQMCAGAGDYFSPSKPHSGTLWRVKVEIFPAAEAADEDNNEENYEEDEDDNESENKEELLQSLSEVMDTVQQQLYANIDDPSVEKCTRFVVKHLKKASAAGNISTLTRILYQIGGLAAHRGEKRKNSGVITIQAASKTRRLHRHRGSGPATSGRKVKDRPSHSRAISEDIDDEDITFAHVRHSLPSQKEKKENKNSL